MFAGSASGTFYFLGTRSTCLSPPSQPHLREMLLLALSLLWRLRLRRDNSLPSDKATTRPLRGSSRPGRSQGVGGPGESQIPGSCSWGGICSGTVTSLFPPASLQEIQALGACPSLSPEGLT